MLISTDSSKPAKWFSFIHLSAWKGESISSFFNDLTNSKYPLKYFGDRRIDNLAPKDIYKYQEWRKDQVSSRKGRAVVGATINREVALIRHALKSGSLGIY
jgi:hypothetical protein